MVERRFHKPIVGSSILPVATFFQGKSMWEPPNKEEAEKFRKVWNGFYTCGMQGPGAEGFRTLLFPTKLYSIEFIEDVVADFMESILAQDML